MRILNRIKSQEYTKLSVRLEDLERKIKALELDLELYVKKLKLSKGLKKIEKDDVETANNKNPVILPE